MPVTRLGHEFAVICARVPGNALIATECENLAGCAPDADGVALCETVTRVPQAAYIRAGLHLLAYGATLDQLVSAVAQADFVADEFRIECWRLSTRARVPHWEGIVALADVIPFYPNLDHPQHRFVLLIRDKGLWFGEIVAECGHTYKRHDAKPCRTSASLPTRLSRALVNLVAPPARSLLDPCCGTGSILLEARSLGLQAYGADWNQRMVEMARENLAYFGYEAKVERADARTYTRTADALVTDLPYGRFSVTDETVIRGILERGRALAPTAVYVFEHNITDCVAAAGYAEIAVYPVLKRAGFARYVHVARSNQAKEGA
ncbi:MAG: methyltransferase domain-containing protein [Anaerolineae bacterium]|nr:methyltransferase domain-containing protein [Anaerolineae bacterium]